jgi:hypothetical protein
MNPRWFKYRFSQIRSQYPTCNGEPARRYLTLIVAVVVAICCQSKDAIAQEQANDNWIFAMDNDGNEARTMKEITPEQFLAQRMGPLADTKLDCIFYCSNGPFGLTTRKSDVFQPMSYVATNRKGHDTSELVKHGVDPLQVTVEFGKKHDIQIFSSIRMNDIHDFNFATVYAKPMFMMNTWKQAHKDWLLSTPEKQTPFGAWSAVNYEIPQVRQKMFDFIEEAVVKYDLDGISLDFFRHPVYFPATFAGQRCGDAERAAMTELIGRVHELVKEKVEISGRPMKLAIRIPDSIQYCNDIGLDVETWLNNGWIDILVVSGYFQLNEWSYSADLGKRYNVTVLASLDESRVKDKVAREARRSIESYRARAEAVRAAGLDGIVTFNLFDPKSQVFNDLGEPSAWAGKPKNFYASVRGHINANGGNLPTSGYRTISILNPANSTIIMPGQSAETNIATGDSHGLNRLLTLRFEQEANPDKLEVSVNGAPVKMEQLTDGWMISKGNIESEEVVTKVTIKLADDVNAVKLIEAVICDRN